ncbi:MAG: DUF4234 domain-containing protein [Erysipelotrichaceae bacterium]|nr:DUF4234 domain-containing protein [Erysipelotrichaceae bacterium]MDY5252986.1 DUF4234 domain-containing protein [Erysipelotrichaceae bacterium]
MPKRSIPLYIVLSLITCGLFAFYWQAQIANDTNELIGDRKGFSGGVVVLLSIITCGIYGLYWLYVTGSKIDQQKATNGYGNNGLAIISLILGIFGLGLVAYAIIQNELNQFEVE